MDISDSFKGYLDDAEKDGQGRKDQSQETESEEEITMNNMDKDRGGRGQIRRRLLKVKPNLEHARKKTVIRGRVKSANRFEVLKGLEGENGE